MSRNLKQGEAWEVERFRPHLNYTRRLLSKMEAELCGCHDDSEDVVI